MPKTALGVQQATIEAKVLHLGLWDFDFSVARCAIGSEEWDMRDFTERVCTVYMSLVCPQSSRYVDLLKALFGDAPSRREYLGGYCIWVGEDCYSLHVNELDSDEERRGSAPSPQCDGGVVESPTPSSAP